MIIKTDRLILRHWQESDLEKFAEMNADPRVMEYFPTIKTFDESLKEYQAIVGHFKQHEYGLWAVSELEQNNFIGFIGLRYIDFPATFTPTVEVGWRLIYDYWGKGYATEGAKASIKHGFENLQLEEIVSFTSTENKRSQNIMKKIGMTHCSEGDFDHPKLAEGHRLRRHVLYRLKLDEWKLFEK